MITLLPVLRMLGNLSSYPDTDALSSVIDFGSRDVLQRL